MAITLGMIQDMEGAGAPAETILAVVKAALARDKEDAEERLAEVRRRDRERKRKSRLSSASADVRWNSEDSGNSTRNSADRADKIAPVVADPAGETQTVVPDSAVPERTADQQSAQKENPPHPLKKNTTSSFLPSLNLEFNEESKKEVVTRARARPATRLADDWQLSDSDRIFAATLLPESRIGIEFDKFRDHWRASARPNAVKRDWSAAWRNWCRRAVEHSGNGNGGGNGKAWNGRNRGSAVTEAINAQIEHYERAARRDGEDRESAARLV